jgi:competence protein ComEC
MRPAPPPAIVPIAAALMAGACCGGARPPAIAAFFAVLAALGAACLARRRPWALTICLMLASSGLGAGVQSLAWHDASARLRALFTEGATRTGAFEGTVLVAPERRRDGTRSLLVRLDDAGGARIRLDVLTVPPDDRQRFDALRCGDRVRVWCRLRAPLRAPGLTAEAARRRLAAQRLDATGSVKSSRLVQRTAPGRRTFGRALDAAHVAALRRLDRALDPAGRERAVLGAMLLGDRGLLDADTNALLRDAGLVHLLSISGLHTAMTVLLLIAVMRRARFGPWGLLAGGGASLLALAILVGNGAAVWRACGSLFVVLAARALAREVDALAALAFSASLFVLAVPALAWNLGFVLSVLATAGLIAGIELGPRCGPVRRSLQATTGAYLVTMPLLARTFGRLAPSGFAANLVAAPLCAACLATGAAAVATCGVPWIGPTSARLAEWSVGALLAVARLAQSIPGGHLRVPVPGGLMVASFAAAGIVWWLARLRGPSRVAALFGLIVSLLTAAMHLGGPPHGPGKLRAEILDVGQGLSVVFRGPDGGCVVYDSGPSHGGRFDAGDGIVVPALLDQGCRRVEVLALSHDHDDHAGGARALLRELEVGAVWFAAGSERDPLSRELAADAVDRGISVLRLRRGDVAQPAGLDVEVLHPDPADRTRPINDRCLALRVRLAGGAAVLLPGDLEAPGERSLLVSGVEASAAALVAPHHGARGSGSPDFLDAVRPRVVAISAGAGNRFGHPAAETLARFEAVGARVVRTDLHGSITLEESGEDWVVSLEHQRRGDEGEDEDQRE